MFFKISIIGTNHFCEKLALTLLYLKNINQIILYSIKKKMHQRKAFNLLEFFNLKKLKNKKILYTNKIKKIKNYNILIINAGIKKKINVKNKDIAEINCKIIKNISKKIKKFLNNTFIICLTEPLELTTYILKKYLNIRNSKLIGIRHIKKIYNIKQNIKQKFNINTKCINIAYIQYRKNIKIIDKLSYIIINKKIKNIYITKCKKNKFFKINFIYSQISILLDVIKSYILNKNKIISCVANTLFLNNKNKIFANIPIKINNNGINKTNIILNKKDENFFEKICAKIKNLQNKFKNIIK